jgi:2-polyprenyl-3-methyl-5-hydroxy-6-metoxy-1,4-benzoquinol methylase
MTAKLNDQTTWDHWWTSSGDFHRYHPGARHRRRLIADVVQKFIFRNPGAHSLLDVGCGDGLLLEELLAKFPRLRRCYGADYTPETIAHAQLRTPGIEFALLDIQAGSLGVQFDIVICAEVIEHLADRRTAFSNLAKMVAPGGMLIITTPQGPIFPTEKYFGHKAHSSKHEMASFGSLCGLELSTCIEWGWPFYNLLKWATNLAPGRSLKAFGFQKYGWWQRAATHLLYCLNFLNCSGELGGYQLIAVFRRPIVKQL